MDRMAWSEPSPWGGRCRGSGGCGDTDSFVLTDGGEHSSYPQNQIPRTQTQVKKQPKRETACGCNPLGKIDVKFKFFSQKSCKT